MSLENNGVIKPAKLVLNPSESQNLPHSSNNAPQNPSFDLSQLQNIISEVVRKESREIFRSFLNPGSDINNDIDQVVHVGNDANLSEMDRIPDVVRSLREFSGQPGEFGSWKKSVDRILNIYEHLKGTPKYYGILSVIRNKITGSADIALESYNTPLNWEKISKCLTLHYADKRDIGTLEYQLTTLVQRNETIPEFYQAVYHHLSLILNKLSSMEMSQESLNIMTQAYRDKALDTFVRGLKGDLPRLLSMKEPADLPQALHLCLKLENIHYRVQHSHGTLRRPQPSAAPPVPPRRIVHPQVNSIPQPRTNFYPELVNNPQRPSKPLFSKPMSSKPVQNPQQQVQYFHNSFPHITNKPEPMDIDHSIHSRAINYQNRQQIRQPQLTNKRTTSQQNHQPNKFQRVFHTEQTANEGSNAENCEKYESYEGYGNYEQNIDNYDRNFDQTLIEHIDSQSQPDLEESEESNQLYFLG